MTKEDLKEKARELIDAWVTPGGPKINEFEELIEKALLEIRNETLEEAAQIAHDEASKHAFDTPCKYYHGNEDCELMIADTILAKKEKG